jgi:membrane-associated phospholipid phosphatase
MLRAAVKRFVDLVRELIRKLNIRNEETPYYITIGIAVLLFGGALHLFIELTDELAENELGAFDTAITGFVQSFRTPQLTSYFKFVTDLGDRYAYIIISVLLGVYFFIRHKSWKFIIQTVLVLLLATVTNIGLKQIINRSRPSLEHLVKVNTLSYPSGHSMSAMAFYGFLVYLSLTLIPNRALKIIVASLLCILILSIGTSRIYLGVHYPSDVAAGFVGGLIWVTLCVIVFNTFSLIRNRKKVKSEATS